MGKKNADALSRNHANLFLSQLLHVEDCWSYGQTTVRAFPVLVLLHLTPLRICLGLGVLSKPRSGNPCAICSDLTPER